jgi:hypothetical protein
MSKVTKENLRDHKMTHDKSNSWWLRDAKGIELCRVCDDCEEVSIDQYPDWVTGRSAGYAENVDEAIESEDY